MTSRETAFKFCECIGPFSRNRCYWTIFFKCPSASSRTDGTYSKKYLALWREILFENVLFEWERSSCVGAARKVSPDIVVVENNDM